MQDTRKALDYYEIYKVTVPRDWHCPLMEDKVKWAPADTFHNVGRAVIGVHNDGYYAEPMIVTAVNNEYCVHPGSSRYLLNRVDPSMPPLTALIVNRYGTTQAQIEEQFYDVSLYDEDFVSFFKFKNNPNKGTVGHTFKPGRQVNKSEFDITVMDTNQDYLSYSQTKISFFYNQRHLVDFGPWNIEPTTQCNVKNMSDFATKVLEVYGL